jgi:hypothetical protein
LRVCNGSGVDMLGVVFQGNHFGDIKSGATSDYQPAASTGLEISAGIPGETSRLQYTYVDYPGRFVSQKGHFTATLMLLDAFNAQGHYLEVKWFKQDD